MPTPPPSQMGRGLQASARFLGNEKLFESHSWVGYTRAEILTVRIFPFRELTPGSPHQTAAQSAWGTRTQATQELTRLR